MNLLITLSIGRSINWRRSWLIDFCASFYSQFFSFFAATLRCRRGNAARRGVSASSDAGDAWSTGFPWSATADLCGCSAASVCPAASTGSRGGRSGSDLWHHRILRRCSQPTGICLPGQSFLLQFQSIFFLDSLIFKLFQLDFLPLSDYFSCKSLKCVLCYIDKMMH